MTTLAKRTGIKPQALRRWWIREVEFLSMRNFDFLTFAFEVRLTAPKIPDPRKRRYKPRRKTRSTTAKRN